MAWNISCRAEQGSPSKREIETVSVGDKSQGRIANELKNQRNIQIYELNFYDGTQVY